MHYAIDGATPKAKLFHAIHGLQRDLDRRTNLSNLLYDVYRRGGTQPLHKPGVMQSGMLFGKNVMFQLEHSTHISRPAVKPEIAAEYAAVVAVAHARQRELAWLFNFPKSFDLREEFGLYLYAIVRESRPSRVVETGAGNGFSSLVILSALDKNGKGTLHTVDVEPGVGALVPDWLRHRWELTIGVPMGELTSVLNRMPSVDLFLHDSDHSYSNVSFELSAASAKLAKGGYILADDVNVNDAFIEFARGHGITPTIIANYRRCFGILRL